MTIADSRYVSLTTYRRSGEAVPVPVWIAPLADGRAGFTTDGTSGKVKRMRNNAEVSLQPCNARGVVPAGADGVAATAAVVEGGPDHQAVIAAIAKKYGIQYRAVVLGGKLKRLFGKGGAGETAVVLTFTD